MSGGLFDYKQNSIQDIVDEIKNIVKDQIDYPLRNEENRIQKFSNKTLKKFNKAIKTLEKAYAMAHRIDWLLSGDDGEETFHKRWKEDLEKL